MLTLKLAICENERRDEQTNSPAADKSSAAKYKYEAAYIKNGLLKNICCSTVTWFFIDTLQKGGLAGLGMEKFGNPFLKPHLI